MFLPDPS